jgi:hypothetical protein
MKMPALALAALLALGSTACTGDNPSTVAPAATATLAARPCAPIKNVLIVDKSISENGARSAAVSPDDLRPALDAVAVCGGELAVGVVHDRLTVPFVRVRLDAPPRPAPEPQWSGNVLERRQQELAFEPVKREQQARAEASQAETRRRVDAFLETVSPLLQHPAEARHSPVWDAVRRADALLAEADPQWPDSRRWIVAVTDGDDDTGAQAYALRSGAQLLVVNGLGETKSLAVLKPGLFDSLAAAFRVVAAENDVATAPSPARVARPLTQ